jgi:N-acetylglucosaminyl-diphospho-decaprenol L-rhamnosyltransferase
MAPAVSVVIVNYNRAALLREAIASVLAQTQPPAEVIVVDNGSADGSADAVEREFGPAIKLVRLDHNLGFAGGNNAGVRVATGEWIALLNNDAVADARWLAEMTARATPGTGLVACRIAVAERRDLLDNLGVALWPDGMSRGASHYLRAAEAGERAPLIPSGCAALVRRSAFHEAGGFDESFFCYSEDTDLFLRIRLLGHGCALAGRAVVYHRGGGGTMGRISADKIYYVERNRIAVLLRYYPLAAVILSPVFTLHRYLGLLAAMLGPGSDETGARVGLAAGAGALGRAYRDALLRAGADLRLRRQWRGRQRLPGDPLKLWIRTHRLSARDLFALEAR